MKESETLAQALRAILGTDANYADLARRLDVEEIQVGYWFDGVYLPPRPIILEMRRAWHLKQYDLDRLLGAAGYALDGVLTIPRNERSLRDATELLSSDTLSDYQRRVLREGIHEAINRAKHASRDPQTLVPYAHPFDHS